MILTIYSDGGSRGNPGPAASAFLVKNTEGEVIFEWSKYLGERTNNQAEYMAVVMAMKWLDQFTQKNSVEKVIYKLDSELIYKQLKGDYKLKSTLLKPYLHKIQELLTIVPVPVVFEHVLRNLNTEADRLVNKALDENSVKEK